MKFCTTALVSVALFTLSLAAPTPAAGEITGWSCDNACPLATEANLHRSFGLESRATAKFARVELTARVERDLVRV